MGAESDGGDGDIDIDTNYSNDNDEKDDIGNINKNNCLFVY